MNAQRDVPRRPAWLQTAARILLLAGLAATLAGIGAYDLVAELPREPALVLGAIGVSAYLLAILIEGVLRVSRAAALLVIWLAALGIAAGPTPILAALLLALAALGLGARLVPNPFPARPAIAVLVGLALTAGILGWLLSVEIHNRLVYAVALLVVIAGCRRQLAELLIEIHGGWCRAVALAPAAADFALLALGLAGTALWLPSLQFDDLAYHLGLGWQLSEYGYYRMDPAGQLWALAPWAGDLIHGVAHVLAREEARAGVNAVWLALGAALAWRLARGLELEGSTAWLVVALFASLPMTAQLFFGMHTEGPSIAVVLAIALVILESPRSPDGRVLLVLAVLAGLMLSLKLSNALSLVPLGLWLLIRWRFRLPWRALPLAILVFVIIGGSSYFHAWALTGNPVLPLYNDVFGAEFARPERFRDLRWIAPVGWDLPWRLSFEIRDYLSAYPGAAGFVLVALAGGLPLGLLVARTRGPVLAGTAVFLLPLVFVPYFRYTLPGLVLLLPGLVAAFGALRTRGLLEPALIGLVVLQLAFQPNANWMLRDGILPGLVLEGREAVRTRYAPETVTAAWVRQEANAGMRVFLADRGRPYIAPFAGRAFTWAWYDHALNRAGREAENDPTGAGWRRLWRESGMTHVLTVAEPGPAMAAALADSELEWVHGEARVHRLPETGPRDLKAERNLARQRLVRKRLLP